MSIKETLLKNKIIWGVNSWIKEKKILAIYSHNVKHYEKMVEKDPQLPYLRKKPNILFVGTDERQDNTGFFQALCKTAGTVIAFTTEDGDWGQYKSNVKERKQKNTERLRRILKETSVQIDCILMQAWGASFISSEINELKKSYGFIVINIDLDSRLVYKRIPYWGKDNPGIFGCTSYADLVLVSTREIVSWYKKEGVPALYFPLASSNSFYYPMEDIKKIYDVGFIGSKYGLREKEVQFLQNSGIEIEARGEGWEHGPINFEENNLFFNQCKIVLGMGNISYCSNFFNPKLRDYDAPMSGSVYITNRTKELEYDYTDGKDIILIDSWQDAANKIKELLCDDDILEEIRVNAYNTAIYKHSYEKQFEDLFSKLSRIQEM